MGWCCRSSWVYTKKGGLLEVKENLAQKISKGQLIGIQSDLFGKAIYKYKVSHDGIVVGKNINLVA